MSISHGHIDQLTVYHIQVPLTRPYQTGARVFENYDLVIAEIRSGEHIGLGETAPVFGYSDEKPEAIEKHLAEWSKQISTMTVGEAIEWLKNKQIQFPFATTPLLSALETLVTPVPTDREIKHRLLGTLLATTEDDIPQDLENLIEKGYQTIKVKVGRDVQADIEKVRKIQEQIGERAIIRLDANRSYNYADALKFVQSVDPGNIQLFEQPFPIKEWDLMGDLAQKSPLPLMLDESIYTEDDVQRIIDEKCASYVKFKLMKSGSIERLISMINKAKSGGLKVVMGNGVAGEIGCLHEIWVAETHIETDGEMNGFLKLNTSILQQPLEAQNGVATIPQGFQMKLDHKKVQKFHVKTIYSQD